MANETKHTPTPWIVCPDEWTDRSTAIITAPDAGPQNRIIAYIGDGWEDEELIEQPDYRALDETDKANTAFIALACNSHEAMVEAAKEILSDFDEHGEVLQTDDSGEYGPSSAVEKLRAAIARATGKETKP